MEDVQERPAIYAITFAFLAISIYVIVCVSIFLAGGYEWTEADVSTVAWMSLVMEVGAFIVVFCFCCLFQALK